MSFEVTGARALDDTPCRYGGSKLQVRGPVRSLKDPYVAFLGSSDTFGKFVEHPFAALVEQKLDLTCVNLGCVNAGVDAYVNDSVVTGIAENARLCVLQVMGAQNLSNRLYRVHPRRNDRFLQASAVLSAIYRDVDFTEFHFNKHLLNTLYSLSPERFRIVREELRAAWLGRMRLLLQQTGPRTVLLWLRYAEPDNQSESLPLGENPLLVTRSMLDELKPDVLGVVELDVLPAGRGKDMADMSFGPLQAPVAEQSIGPRTHARIAARLTEALAPDL